MRAPLRLIPALLLLFGFFPTTAFAWGEHTLASYPALGALPEIANAAPVRIESLEQFLSAEEQSLVTVLAEEEQWARANVPNYPERPAALAFEATGNALDLRERFVRAIRINPNSRLLSYTQRVPRDDRPGCQRIPASRITFLRNIMYLSSVTFCEYQPGQSIPALDVVASGADEPDYGLDIGLFEDGETEFGKQYGFGAQPFGNPALEFSSQAPFHMGFFHESWIVYQLAPFLGRTFPEYRAHLYMTLARHAFATGHDYWGYRFMGWGLHYVQDLTQPYHATVLPGVSVFKMLWINFLNVIGFGTGQKRAVQLVSNRHLALEDFQKRIMKHSYVSLNLDYPIFAALEDTSTDSGYGTYNDRYLRDVITVESTDRATELDETLSEAMPEQFVQDPEFNFDSNDNPDALIDAIAQGQLQTEQKMAEPLGVLFRSFGAHSRNYARAVLE